MTPFEQRWLAEATRLREHALGPADDAAAVRAARAGAGKLEQRLLFRAAALAEKNGLLGALTHRKQHAAYILLVAGVLALMAGATAATAVLGDGGRPVNVVWAMGGLLGLNTLTLLLWLAGRWLPVGQSGSLIGHLWLRLQQKLGDTQPIAWVIQAEADIARQRRATFWWLGRISHAMWLTTLFGALVTLIFLLATRRYGFVWETTILPPEVFVRLTQALGALPAALGASMPDARMVLDAGGATPVDADRHAWSAWLVATLVVYGIGPRAACLALCHYQWRRARQAFRLDLTLPHYLTLQARLQPDSEHTGIRSQAPAHLPRFHAGHRDGPDDGGPCLMALELADDLPWPPPGFPPTRDAGRIDSREARHQALDQLALHGAERLLVAIDARLSPDRGALALIAELSRYASDTAVWSYGVPADPARQQHWRDGLAQIDLPASRHFETEAAARQWLEPPHA
ncbi:MAG: DUF2868 domain-containing protein [Proteobacteria bacterium]|nr:MAG: DUF2868 domain-containing protein [Pseudomonadota bacterium]